MTSRYQENTPRVVALAAAFFGGLALLGSAAGVFERLGPELTAMLGGFVAAFAVLTYQLDPGVRAFVRRWTGPRGRKAPGPTPAV